MPTAFQVNTSEKDKAKENLWELFLCSVGLAGQTHGGKRRKRRLHSNRVIVLRSKTERREAEMRPDREPGQHVQAGTAGDPAPEAAGLTGSQDQLFVKLVRHDGLRQVPARSREKAELRGAAPVHRWRQRRDAKTRSPPSTAAPRGISPTSSN